MMKETIKAQTKQELAQKYVVSARTLTNWLRPHKARIGERIGHTYTPKQVEVIYEVLGRPEN